jgi:hypothetical protein
VADTDGGREDFWSPPIPLWISIASVGRQPTRSAAIAALSPTAETLAVTRGQSGLVKARVLSAFVSQKMISFTVNPNAEDLEVLKELVEAGEVSPVID